MKLENWRLLDNAVAGKIYGATFLPDGSLYTTRNLVNITDTYVEDYMGTVFELGLSAQDSSTKLVDLIHNVESWADDKGLFVFSTAKDQALKTVSEVGEFADNVLKGNDCRDDIGDILVTLIVQCVLQNTSLTECLELAYNTISKRTGKTVNGTFIKDANN